MNSSCIGNLPYSYDGAFAQDLIKGLASSPKNLPCKWFYDARGSELFEKITATSEYYLARAETALLVRHGEKIATHLQGVETVIEPGSGSGIKTRLLLQSLPNLKRYIPIDISTEFMLISAEELALKFPELRIEPHTADFATEELQLQLPQDVPTLIFFPGSTIGNFAPQDAEDLLRSFRWLGNGKAQLLIGVDMTQDEAKLLPAYNDQAGVTAEFNLNLLQRANRELGTDFVLENFSHIARYNQEASRVEMHLRSKVAQCIHFHGQEFHFDAGETIHTENCYKYGQQQFEQLAAKAGWHLEKIWQDGETSAFALLLLNPIS